MIDQPVLCGGAWNAGAEPEMAAARSTLADWVQIVRSEFLEIPGLRLTRPQVRRLWNLDDATTDALLEALTAAKFLRRTSEGAYVLVDSGAR